MLVHLFVVDWVTMATSRFTAVRLNRKLIQRHRNQPLILLDIALAIGIGATGMQY
jgi:hypothetical protein